MRSFVLSSLVGRYVHLSLLTMLVVLCALFAACVGVKPPTDGTVPTTSLPPTDTALTTPAPLGATEPISAVLTFVQGEVELEAPTALQRAPGLMALVARQQTRQAKGMQQVRQGTKIHTGANSQVTVICSNNRIVRVVSPGVFEVTGQSCNRGVQSPANSASAINASHCQGQPKSCETQLPKRERESDYGRIPVILSPLNTSLLTLAPDLQWVAVAGAIEYVLKLSGSGSFPDVILDATQLHCLADATAAHPVCTVPWSTTPWTLTAGKRYFLTISARLDIVSPLRDSDKASLRTLAGERVTQAQNELAQIQALQLDPVTTDLLLGGIYTQYEIYMEAIPAYQRALAVQPSPMLHNLLGDTYRVIDLQRYAFNAYQDAIKLLSADNDDPVVRAAAEFGLGQVAYRQTNFKLAEPHFVKAVELYRQFGVSEELQAAQKALEETQKRL